MLKDSVKLSHQYLDIFNKAKEIGNSLSSLTAYSLIMELRSDCIGQKWEGHVKTLLYVIYCTFYNKILSDKKKVLF